MLNFAHYTVYRVNINEQINNAKHSVALYTQLKVHGAEKIQIYVNYESK